MCGFHRNAQFVEKLERAMQFVLRLSQASIFDIMYQNYQNDSFEIEISKNLEIVLLQANHW